MMTIFKKHQTSVKKSLINGVHYTESNGISEAFVKTFKRDYVWPNDISNAKIVLEKLDEWFEDYNERAPHKALKMLSPREFIEKTKLAG